MSKLITAEKAASLIKDEDTIALSALGLAGWPEEVAIAIEKRYLNTRQPKNLTIRQGSATGDWKTKGVTRLGHEGLVKEWIAAHIGSAKKMNELVRANKMLAYCLPQGVIVNLWREIAAKRPGLITKVGLNTFVDPRYEGGKMNEVTKKDIVKLIDFEGQEWLFYKTFDVDVALIRGTSIDEQGNLSMENEGFINEALAVAEATKNTGGIVIAQAEYLVDSDSINPKDVKVPGVLVDYIVIATNKENCWQTEGTYYNPAFAGKIKVPNHEIPRLKLNTKKVIARRAAMELKEGMVVNLGIGIPTDIAAVLAEEDVVGKVVLTTEAGSFGGVPACRPDFGCTYNAEALIDHGSMFDFYDGGGLDIAFLGMAQVDRLGNVNVSKFCSKLIGPGGFINITQNTGRVVFCGCFSAGAEVVIDKGKLCIIKEGRSHKFVHNVAQITFSGPYAVKTNQSILYITERGVFELRGGEVTLIEIAPGIDLKRDILNQMEYMPKISDNLKEIDSGLYDENWGILETIMYS